MIWGWIPRDMVYLGLRKLKTNRAPFSMFHSLCADAWAAFFVTVEKRREERVRQTIPVYEA